MEIQSQKHKQILRLTPTLLMSIVTSIFFILLTAQQPLGVSPDSVSYLDIAQNISTQGKLVNYTGQLNTHHPPGYPLLTAVTSRLFNLKLISAARYLNAALLAGTIFVFNLLLKQFNLKSKLRLALSLLLVLSPAFSPFFMAWSEPAFIFFLLLTTLVFFQWLDSRHPKYLILTGLLATILISLRYAGLNFLATIAFYLLFLDSTSKLRHKLKNTLIFLAHGLIFPLIWFTLSHISQLNPFNRTLQLHLVSHNHWYRLITTIAHWFIPYQIAQNLIHQVSTHLTAPTFSRLVFVTVVVTSLISFIIFKKHLKPRLSSKSKQQTLFLLVSLNFYLLFLFTSISLFDLATPLDNRILAPIYPLALILISLVLSKLRHQLRPTLILVWLILMFLPYATNFRQRLSRFHHHGLKYTSTSWQNSNLISSLAAQPKTKTIYSNGADLLRFYLNIDQDNHYQIKPFPQRFNLHTGDNTPESKKRWVKSSQPPTRIKP